MKFQPKTAKEIAEAGLWPKGRYAFQILEAEETVSKSSGADMIKLKVKVFKDNGASQNIFDYLLDAIPHKLRHLAEACGLLAQYEMGELNAYELIGKTGECQVVIQKDKTGAYPDKNAISDYCVGTAPKTVEEAVAGDDVPF